MDIERLKQKTQKLREAIEDLEKSDHVVEKLRIEIEPLMKLAESGMIPVKLQWRDIPGRYLFTEESLQEYSLLEHAFAEFRIELTGGETPLLRKLKKEMGEG
ncbi:hypothetical protein [Pseudomonas syringae]|uniref:Uncharacterized protein n=4 Tax=Pseudomonas syringae TaxID=317 RepID=A0A656JQW5_PSESF|nr:hypothetical protein [Pseudomonas syringae]EPN47191.1 hypothetical protein A245_31428 [Pseudomonas syringae pv. actinidiae ICMP 19096]EPM49446.1 hypothetical protein A246_07858 [Pseudomonas syringae pv. actinidiae ICMP 19098]EPN08782.1 hypothetical protein A249_11812 [Pseudomonas syringae pv. actinidiae ICMP 18804]EPN19955.1 hypothetical protein A248_07992 [Pseudomonas syringae pv. actinidiae ICMP 19100]EPN27717.1 hypothetical protein A247_08003 [Pseudomonas syringae pv. actinidiae ICMP 190